MSTIPIFTALVLALVSACADSSSVANASNWTIGASSTCLSAVDESGSRVMAADATEDATETDADREVTRAVRQHSLVDTALSTNLERIKISSRDGRVTLRGVVDSAEERSIIAARVRALPDVTEYDDQLELNGH